MIWSYPIRAECLLRVPPGLTLKNSRFSCKVYLYVLYGFQKKKQQLFPLYKIKYFVLIAEAASVYRAVRADSWTVIEVIHSF